MRKLIKLSSLAVMLVAMLAVTHLAAFASVASPVAAETSEAVAGQERVSAVSDVADETDQLNNVATPIAESLPEAQSGNTNSAVNPATGAERLYVPAVVAFIAASVAAVTLTARKKD